MIVETINLLGLTGEDRVTGAVGVIECVSFDLYGCVQLTLRRPVNEKGESPDTRWYDVSRIKVLDQLRVMFVPAFQEIARRPDEYPHGPADKPVR